MYSFEMQRLIDAPADVVWDVISEPTFVAAPNLHKVEVISGEGEGMRRRCIGKDGDTWTEQCVLWEEQKVVAFEVDTHSSAYPLTYMRGTFRQEQRSDGVLVTMHFDFVPKFNPPLLGRLVVVLASRSLKPLGTSILDNWEAEIRERSRARQAI